MCMHCDKKVGAMSQRLHPPPLQKILRVPLVRVTVLHKQSIGLMQEFNIESVVNILLQLYNVGAHRLCMGLSRV